MRGREARLGCRALGTELLTKERDSVTDKSSKLAEEADNRERDRRTEETERGLQGDKESGDTLEETGTGKEGQKKEPGGGRVRKKTKEIGGVGRVREMSNLESHRQ